jgi:hypothetical protein
LGKKGRWALLVERHDEKNLEKTHLSGKDVFKNSLLVIIVHVKELKREAMYI